MPAEGPQNTRAKQLRRVRKRKTPAPTKRQIAQARAQARTYKSQGEQVEKTANRQIKARRVRQHEAKDVKSDADRNRGKPESKKNIAEARIKYLRRTRKPVTTLKKELEGTGLLAKGLKKAGETAGYVSTGGGPNVAVGAGRKATSGSWKPRGSAAITTPQLVSAKRAKGAGRFAKDLVNFPAQAIPSLYVPIAAAYEAGGGNTKRGKKFLKDIEKHDPVYNLGAAVVEKVGGDSKTAARNLKRAKKAASEHPGFTALEVAGVKGTAGRAGGRVKKAPARAPVEQKGTSLADPREYSPDIIKRQREKAVDRHKTRKATKLRAKAERATSDEDVVALHRKANRVDPTKMTPAQVRRRVDERVAANEDVRRINRTQVTRDVDEAVKPAKRGGAALSLVSQRIVKPDKADLKAYRDEIAGHFDELPKSGKRANRQLRKSIDDVLDDPRADMGKVTAAARRYEEITAPLQKKLSERGLLAEGQADKAKLIPYAVRNMGARHDPDKGIVVRKKVIRVVPDKDAPVGSGKVTPAQRANGEAPPVPKGHVRLYRGSGHFPGATLDENSGRWFAINIEKARKYGERMDYVDVPEDVALATQHHKLVGGKGPNREFLLPKEWASRASEHKPLTAKPAPKKIRRVTTEEDVTLRPREIRRHMAKNETTEPAFLSQAPNMRGAKNFYMASDKAPQLRASRRTGEATRKGTFDAHPDTLRENAARAQGLADATDGFTNFIGEFAHRDGSKPKTFKTRKEAEAFSRDALSDDKGRPTGDLELRPVRVNPWGASKEQLQRLLDEVDSDSPTAAKAVADVIEDALKEGAEGDGPWALVPKAAADQMAKHMRVTGPGSLGKGAQLVNSSFRKTVLSTSPGWLLGNITEAAMRTALAKAGPRSYMTGRKVIKQLEQTDPEAAKAFTVRSTGGGHYAMADRSRHADHTQFEDTAIEGLARKMGALWQAPGPKQAAGAWRAWTTSVFHVNKKVEGQFQTAMAGRLIRDSHLMDGRTLKTGSKAVEQAAEGLKNTNEQVAFGRAVDRMYGKYNKFSPEGRSIIANYTPFVAWSLNALKFVVDVLPRDHPTVTAAIAASEIATAEWRKDKGLDLFIEERVPAFLQGSIPTKGGGKFRASRYTPFGAFGSPLETATGAVLPQLSGVLAAGKGEDWKGAKLRVNGREANEIERWGFAAQAFAEATVPILSVGKRVAKDGPAALNPVKTISGKKKIRRKSGVSWDDGGSGIKWDDQSSGVKWDG